MCQECIPVSICQYLYTAIHQIIRMATPSEPSISNRYYSVSGYGQPQDWVPVYYEDGGVIILLITHILMETMMNIH